MDYLFCKWKKKIAKNKFLWTLHATLFYIPINLMNNHFELTKLI